MEQSASQRRVVVIPKTPVIAITPEGLVQRKRVCAYCRVSTKQEQQLESLENQTLHYTEFIQKHADWEFAGIYADPGLSGTMLKKRDEFNRMVADAKAGKFDLVLIKSIARYCRNTIDSIKTARELTACGVVIYFEKENLYSNDPNSTFAFTLFSSFAQEESRSISDNVARGYRMKFKTGTAKVRTTYGYESDGNGSLKIIEGQAGVVRQIFREYIDGYTAQQIALQLNAEGIPSRTGRKWNSSVIQNMLQNEKYIGDCLFQKMYTVDFLTHQTVKNDKGFMESYYTENTHPAIINKKDYALVQAEIKRRDELRGKTETGWSKYSGKYAFSNLLRCGVCSGRYRRHSYEMANSQRKRIWMCQSKEKKGCDCTVKFTIPETELEIAFGKMVNELLQDKTILSDCIINIAEAIDTGMVNEQLEQYDKELEQHRQRLYQLMQEQTKSPTARRFVDEEMQKVIRKSESIQAERDRLISNIERSNLDARRMEEIKAFIDANNPLEKFDRDLFRKLIHQVIVHSRHEVEFFLYMGVSRRVRLDTTK